MPLTTIGREFCAYLDNIIDDNFYFRLNGSEAFVIIPYREIEWMAPSKELWKEGYKQEELTLV